MQSKVKTHIPDLTELIDTATKYIISQGYSKSAIKQHTGIWKKLLKFAELNEENLFSLELAAKFMKETYGIKDIFKPDAKKERWRVRYVWCLEDFREKNNFVRHREYNITPIPEAFNEIYSNYKEYLTNKKQKPRSILTKLSRIKVFLLFLHEYGISEAKGISTAMIIEFIGNLKCSSAYRGNILITLRDFLKCPFISKELQNSSLDVLKSIHLNRYERLPSFLSDEEIKKMLLEIDRHTLQGKKDYAIIIIAVELGLRASDIRNLQLDDIKWDKSTIELFQQKTGEFIQLYMTDNVKWALLDYLMNFRPKDSEYNNVFIRSKAPFTPYSRVANFHDLINKYMSLAKINTANRHHGLHSCRHALASRLMNDGTPINIVSEALGHKFANVTKEYTRLDISRLRLVALEVPYNA